MTVSIDDSNTYRSAAIESIHVLLIVPISLSEKPLLRLIAALPKVKTEVKVARSFSEASRLLDTQNFEICVMDPTVDDNKGADFITEVKLRCPSLPIIILVSDSPTALDIESIHAGATDYLTQSSLTSHQLELSFRYVMNRASRERQLFWNVEAQRTIKEVAVNLASITSSSQESIVKECLKAAAGLFEANALALMFEGKTEALWLADENPAFKSGTETSLIDGLNQSWTLLSDALRDASNICNLTAPAIHRQVSKIGAWAQLAEKQAWCVSRSGNAANALTILVVFSNHSFDPSQEDRLRTLRELSEVFRANLERIHAASILEQTRKKYKDLVENIGDGLMLCDLEENVIQVNCQLCELLSSTPEKLLGMKSYEVLLPPGEHDRIKERISRRHQGISETYEIHIMRRDGTQFWGQVRAAPVYDESGLLIGTMGTICDITTQKAALAESERLHRELLQSQKMQAVGEISNGIAAEISSSLGIITKHLQVLESDERPQTQKKISAHAAFEQCESAKSILNRLIELAQPSRGEPVVSNPSSLVSESIKFLSSFLGPGIELMHESIQDTSRIEIDPIQFRQILVTAVLATKSAMPHGGRVTISHAHRAPASVVLYGPPRAGNIQQSDSPIRSTIGYAVVVVEDTSSQLSAGQLRRLLLPRLGEGTAVRDASLALASLSSIMVSIGGLVDINPLPVQGTRIELSFPLFRTHSENSEMAMSHKKAPGNKVLVVDDEEMLVQLLQRFLEMSGIQSHGSSSPEAALHWYKENHEDVGLVVMDLKMSRMDGRECFSKMREIDSSVRVGFLSGYIEKEVEEDLLRRGALRFFQKPLRYPELVDWVKFALTPSP